MNNQWLFKYFNSEKLHFLGNQVIFMLNNRQ